MKYKYIKCIDIDIFVLFHFLNLWHVFLISVQICFVIKYFSSIIVLVLCRMHFYALRYKYEVNVADWEYNPILCKTSPKLHRFTTFVFHMFHRPVLNYGWYLAVAAIRIDDCSMSFTAYLTSGLGNGSQQVT